LSKLKINQVNYKKKIQISPSQILKQVNSANVGSNQLIKDLLESI